MSFKFKEFTIITEPSIDDAESAVKMLNKVGGETDNLSFGENEFHITIEEEKEFFKKQKERKTGVFCMVKNKEKEVIANATAFPCGRRSSHVFDFGISILKAYWGQGLGNVMMQTIIKECKKLGAEKITLHVRSDNHPAIHLYEKYGFEKEGLLKKKTKIGNKYSDDFVMGLFL